MFSVLFFRSTYLLLFQHDVSQKFHQLLYDWKHNCPFCRFSYVLSIVLCRHISVAFSTIYDFNHEYSSCRFSYFLSKVLLSVSFSCAYVVGLALYDHSSVSFFNHYSSQEFQLHKCSIWCCTYVQISFLVLLISFQHCSLETYFSYPFLMYVSKKCHLSLYDSKRKCALFLPLLI